MSAMENTVAQEADDSCPHPIWNLTTSDAVEAIMYGGIEELFLKYLLPIIEIIGIGGNLSFIIIVLKVPSMKTITNAYLVNIAIADLCFISYACTLYMVSYYTSPIRYDSTFTNRFACLIVWIPTWLTYFASILLITLATVEKYYGICHPFQHRLVTGKKRTVRIVILSWLVAAAFTGVVLLRHAKLQVHCMVYPDEETYAHLPKQVEFCLPISAMFRVVSEAVAVTSFFLALLGNVYMYGRIIYALSNRSITKEKEDSIQLMQKQIRNQVAKVLIINGMVFFCCQFPYRFLSVDLFVQAATGERFFTAQQYGLIAVVGRCLVLINSLANPFVYFFSSANYRQGYYEAFCCKGKQQSMADSSQTSSIRLSTNPEGNSSNGRL